MSAYGANDFPFHGRPYGHPYDPWTWPYMSGSTARARPVLRPAGQVTAAAGAAAAPAFSRAADEPVIR